MASIVQAQEVEVNASPSQTLKYWENEANYPLFMSGVDHVKVIDSQANRIGVQQKLLECSGSVNGKETVWICSIKINERHREIVWKTERHSQNIAVAIHFLPFQSASKVTCTRLTAIVQPVDQVKDHKTQILLNRMITSDLRKFRSALEKHFLTSLTLKEGAISQDETAFNDSVAEWFSQTWMIASPEDKFNHPAYQRIIEMGNKVLPFIFDEFQEEPFNWFFALRRITGENPVQPGSSYEETVKAWLRWGEKRNYVTDIP